MSSMTTGSDVRTMRRLKATNISEMSTAALRVFAVLMREVCRT
jgi:hypothetical protein